MAFATRTGRIVLLVVAIGLIPLVIGTFLLDRQSKRNARAQLDAALAADAQAAAADLDAYFDRARTVARLAGQNPVFRGFYELRGERVAKIRRGGPEMRQVNEALAFLQRLYPGAIGEACFIDRTGPENARVVNGVWAPLADLSPNEGEAPFFHPTFALPLGEVYQARPYVSPDMHEWVISNSTPIALGGRTRAIVHFEITVESLRRTLAREAGHHLYVVDRRTGAVLVDADKPQGAHDPLGRPGDRRFASAVASADPHAVVRVPGARAALVRVGRERGNVNDWVVAAAAKPVGSSVIGVSRTGLALLALLLVAAAIPIAKRWGGLESDLDRREEDLRESEHRYRIQFHEAEAARALLAEQNERLRDLDRLKDDFVASVSHELRTPLTSIRGYLELVLDGEAGELNPEQLQFLGVAQRNSERLLRLVSDLLFVAQVDAGKIALERAAVDLKALVGDAAEAARPAAEAKEIELSVRADSVDSLDADPARVAQILDNLISNAIKFTPAGGRVEVATFLEGGSAIVEVSDTGMGIAPADQQQLFQRFFRTEAATTAAIQGTGLGLAIVKAIVEAHGGEISVQSNIGVGTTFRITLPMDSQAVSSPRQAA